MLGVEFRPEAYNAVAVDLEGNIVFSKFELIRLSGANLTEGMLEVLGRLQAELQRTGLPLLGVGVGLSGVVNPRKRPPALLHPAAASNSPTTSAAEIAARIPVPTYLENDANACAWGELAFHRARRLQDFLFLLVEFRDIQDQTRFHERTAVGIGIVLNGKVYHGYDCSAGEFRSVLCTPDSRGQFSLSAGEAFRVEEDPAVLSRFIRELSANVAMLVNTFNLGSVFLGGDIERYKKEVQAELGEAVQRNWPYPDGVSCRIRFSSLGEKAVAYGAAGMVLHRLFSETRDPWIVERLYRGVGAPGEVMEGKPLAVEGRRGGWRSLPGKNRKKWRRP